jgi:transcriptional regulator with XRE-family HTH domain
VSGPLRLENVRDGRVTGATERGQAASARKRAWQSRHVRIALQVRIAVQPYPGKSETSAAQVGDKRRVVHYDMAITRASVRLESERRMRRLRLQVGEDIRRLRLDAGLTLTELGSATGIHRSHLARIEAGVATPSLEALVAIGVALGADLSLRYFAGAGPRLVDRFQAPMIEGFVRSLDPRWSVRLEVPVLSPARGVVDAALVDRVTPVALAAEFQSELHRVEQQIRWNTEKADGLANRLAEEAIGGPAPVVSRLLVLRSTTTIREIGRRYEATLRTAYPARTGDVIEALTTPSCPWPGPGIAWMRVEGGVAGLLDGPPRGVRLGR